MSNEQTIELYVRQPKFCAYCGTALVPREVETWKKYDTSTGKLLPRPVALVCPASAEHTVYTLPKNYQLRVIDTSAVDANK